MSVVPSLPSLPWYKRLRLRVLYTLRRWHILPPLFDRILIPRFSRDVPGDLGVDIRECLTANPLKDNPAVQAYMEKARLVFESACAHYVDTKVTPELCAVLADDYRRLLKPDDWEVTARPHPTDPHIVQITVRPLRAAEHIDIHLIV